MSKKHYTGITKSSLDDYTDGVFRKRKPPTLESIESFLPHFRYRGSAGNEQEGHIADTEVTRRAKSVFVPPTENLRPSIVSGVSLTSRLSRKTHRSVRSKRKRKTVNSTSGESETYDVHNQYYAGIGHSDLDIQTGRPPLMFQMNFVEWLWFQSVPGQRFIFMVVGALFCFVLMNFFFGLYLMLIPERDYSPYLCNTDECNYLSQRLLETINKSVDPCDDFYSFVCGSSDIAYNLSKDEDEEWHYGFDTGRVVYDFRYSQTLGLMLKKIKTKPANLILDMYQACLEERKRDKLGLQPYFELLKELGLYHVAIDLPLKANDVISSMAKILSHSMHTSAILRVTFYKENASSSPNAYIESAITEPFLAGAVFRYGYKRYRNTIFDAFTMMKTELNLTEGEIEILSHDIICLELYFFQTVDSDKEAVRFKEVVDDVDNIGHKQCEVGETFSGTDIKANFGQAPNGDFDFDLLIRLMYKQSNPDWNQNSDKTPFGTIFEDVTNNSRTDEKFVASFSKEFSRSAPIRLMRYLQWRILYGVAFQLNHYTTDMLINIERHNYLGLISNCFHCVFTWLPYLAQYTFLENSRTNSNAIIDKLQQMLNIISLAYSERNKFRINDNMERVLNTTLTNRQKKIIDKILQTNLRAEVVMPVEFRNYNVKMFRELYQNLDFDKDHHLENIMKMGSRIHEWKTTPKYEHVFYEINPKYRVPVLVDKSMTSYDRILNKYRMYLPMATVESPFTNDGLLVSNLGGLGMEIAGNLEKAFYSSLVFPLSQEYLHRQFDTGDFQNDTATEEEVDNAEDDILKYHSALKEKYRAQIVEYKMGNQPWNKIKYESAMAQILTIALLEQSQIHALSIVVNVVLISSKKHGWIERKSYLHGLKEYNIRQIFFMALVNRRCEKVGPKKFAQISEYGPLPQAISKNMALSNLEDFSIAFKCPVGSRMNRKDKVSFWDKRYGVYDPKD